MNTTESTGTFAGVRAARDAFPPDLVSRTRLKLNESEELERTLLLKLENEQTVRSYKVRGAAWKLLSLPRELLRRGAVCASAGNHAQGFAACCNLLGMQGMVFVPEPTTDQKKLATRRRGNGCVEIRVEGAYYDETAAIAQAYAREREAAFIHPFDDWRVIEGQGTVALEIAEEMERTGRTLEAVVVPVGGGGLLAGTILTLKHTNPDAVIFGVEPEGAACMAASVAAGEPVHLKHVDTFVDGAAVARPGDRPFSIVSDAVREGRVKLLTVPNIHVVAAMHRLLQIDGVIAEPAGALSVAAIDRIMPDLDGKGDVVSIISGGNIDFERMKEVFRLIERHRTSLQECLKPV
ncbi:MAG: pyridoxal-phosphate dependent enzyme [Candidatus Peribacteraceae bacterium]